MKQGSIIKFVRKCLNAGYKEQVCKDAWMFGKLPDTELEKMFQTSFKDEKVFIWPYSVGKRGKTLKHKKIPEKVTKDMMLLALGPRFESVLK